jgi:uncharacterized protein YcaQ
MSSVPAEPVTVDAARRLALARQRLVTERPPADRRGILEVVRELGCLQLDPTSAVARSHLLVLWSRLGPYDPAELDVLLWEDGALFEYWAHAASIVLTEDLPIHEATLMRTYARGRTAWDERVRGWVRANDALRRHILRDLRRRGPLRSRDLARPAAVPWESSGWTADQGVTRMLTFLWAQGKIAVAGRNGQERLWDLRERVLPPVGRMSERDAVRLAAEKAIRALGVASAREITRHFIRDRYRGLEGALRSLERAGRILRVRVENARADSYIHADHAGLLDGAPDGERVTLLSPFDNLICDRERTVRLFNFEYRIEIYTPKAKRRYGFFVMPVLAGERLIGRVDPRFDRKANRLILQSVHVEPGVAKAELERALEPAAASLGRFLGAEDVDVRR